VWVDADGDGWGNSAYPDTRCGDLTGWATVDGDCDDGAAAVHPAADERCDTPADDDCDGATNEPGAVDGVPLHGDLDGDGFGDAAVTEAVCAAGDGWVDDATDCDDTDAGVNPGAEEVCNTGVDEDCDAGTACRLAGEVSVEGADVTWSGDDAEEGGGWAFPAGDLSGDGIGDLALVTVAGVVLKEAPEPGEWEMDQRNFARIIGSTTEEHVSRGTGGDFNGDGEPDLAVWALDGVSASSSPTSVNVFHGPFVGDYELDDARFSVLGAAGEVMGIGISSAGDTTGDGQDELWVGVPLEQGGAGGVYLFQPDAGVGDRSDALASVVGEPGASLGYGVATGDMDGDGVADLIVAAPGSRDGAGAVYVYIGLATTLGAGLGDADVMIQADSPGDGMGAALEFSPVSDANGDGVSDLFIGASGDSGSAVSGGAAFLFMGPVDGSLSESDASAVFHGTREQGRLGFSFNGTGDFDGDGRGDLVVGGQAYAADGADRIYLHYGPASGTRDEADLDVLFTSPRKLNGLGVFFGVPGDVNGDRADDLVLADGEASVSGETYLFFGTGF
jgi:hypothetical protein